MSLPLSSNIVAIIPARSGSKGVKDKNIYPLAGKPLLAYSVRAALLANSIDEVFISTDSTEYAQLAKSYGASAPFIRPAELSTDISSDRDFVLHFLAWYQEVNGLYPRCLVHLRPTTPLRDPSIIDLAIAMIKNTSEKATCLRSVHEMSETAYKCFEIEDNQLVSVFSREKNLDCSNLPRQAYQKTYQPNGYVDILKTEHVLSGEGLSGSHVLAFETPVVTEIDTIDDLDYLAYQVNKSKKLFNQLFGEQHVASSI